MPFLAGIDDDEQPVFESLEVELLAPAIEKLGGCLDLQTDRALVYSIHVSIGFAVIEELLNTAGAEYPDSFWYYGNVYDPDDGTTPMLWWQQFDSQE